MKRAVFIYKYNRKSSMREAWILEKNKHATQRRGSRNEKKRKRKTKTKERGEGEEGDSERKEKGVRNEGTKEILKRI